MRAQSHPLPMVILLFLSTGATAQTLIGTAFTYQGRLTSATQPASGPHDLQFSLFEAATGDVQVGSTLCLDNVNVAADGTFTAALDFGAVFGSRARFLEIDVRSDTGLSCLDATGFNLLSPRQQVTPAPVATHALHANALDAPDGNPVSALHVNNAGFVGIGTTTPVGPLEVRSGGGSFLLLDSANGDMRFNGGADGFFGFFNEGAAAGHTQFISNSIVNMSIANNGGAVGIGTLPVAGARLKVAGTAEADEFRFAADKIINISIDGSAFNPVDQSNIGDTGEGRYAAGTTAIMCGVSLPDGMVITDVRWFIRDISGNNLNLILTRTPRPYAFGNPILFVAQSFSSGTPGVTTLVNSGVNHTVNNVNATYQLAALPAISGNSWDGGNIGIQGLAIVGTIRTPR